MQVTLTLTEKEAVFLGKLAASYSRIQGRELSIEDAVHECIESVMFDKGEAAAQV